MHRFTYFILLILLLSGGISHAQETYQMPPESLADLIDAPPTPRVSLDPTNQWLLLMERPNLMQLETLAQPELGLARLRINPAIFGPSRVRYITNLRLMDLNSGQEYPVSGLPEDAKLSELRWSPNGQYIAMLNTVMDGQQLWVVDVAQKSARQLTDRRLNNCYYGYAYDWLPDNQTLICRAVPENYGPPPEEPLVPAGPIIQASSGRKAPARTYQDLLENPHDEALFEYYFSGELLKVTLDDEVTSLSEPAIFAGVSVAPGGEHLLVETIHRPFSYQVPAYRFPHLVEVWDTDGQLVNKLYDQPLQEEIPMAFGSVQAGPRNFDWRSDVPATVYWVEAQDGGDAGADADIRDKLYTLDAPFDGEPQELMAFRLRFSDVAWGHDNLALASEWWWSTRQIRTWKVDPSTSPADTSLLIDHSWEDRYNDPGEPLMTMRPNGHVVLLTNEAGETIYMRGDGASPEGDRPFIDALNLTTGESERLWRSEAPYYERVVELLDPNELTLITRRESVSEPPNYYRRDLTNGNLTALTEFPHPTPQLKDVQKELIRYPRADGVDLTGTLYLPPGYSPEDDGPLPMLMWAYPQEFKSADAAGQVTDSPYRFVRVGWWSPLLWLVQGYAVLDDPTMPVIGEEDEEPNDTYIEQLVSSARAAVDEVVKRGVADSSQIAIGGHSYGAFMAANLLSHCDLFAAGIARSGAYNRTLTPFGFQAEERSFWEAREVYMRMSPFTFADQMNEPLLLVHGEADNNSGTYPLQSERYFDALKGHGATARLVMLPHESHSYRARASIMHMVYEMDSWLETHVKADAGE